MTTALFTAMNDAEAAFKADPMNLDLLNKSDEAYRAYVEAVAAARNAWEAIGESDAKGSATDNAFDTEGTGDDMLYWFEIATRTYEMNMSCRDYNSDGSAAS